MLKDAGLSMELFIICVTVLIIVFYVGNNGYEIRIHCVGNGYDYIEGSCVKNSSSNALLKSLREQEERSFCINSGRDYIKGDCVKSPVELYE